MTYREAIESFQMDECADCYAPIEECRRCPVGLAIESLEKQEPKKPNETDAYPHRVYCPNCYWTFWYNKENIIRDMYKYCPDCGQAIDWSEDE